MRRVPLALGCVLAALTFAPGAGSLFAQSVTEEHPAEIRSGACAGAGDVVAPLANLVVPAADAAAPPGVTPVGQSYTVAPVPLATLLGSAHMLVVYVSPGESTVPVACSDIAGPLGPDGALAIALNPVSGSGRDGVAYFAPTPAGDATAVTVLLNGGRPERVERPEREREERTDGAARSGEDGTAGIAGLDGADGADGQPGQPGKDGAPGQPGEDGAPGGQGGNGGDGGPGGSASA